MVAVRVDVLLAVTVLVALGGTGVGVSLLLMVTSTTVAVARIGVSVGCSLGDAEGSTVSVMATGVDVLGSPIITPVDVMLAASAVGAAPTPAVCVIANTANRSVGVSVASVGLLSAGRTINAAIIRTTTPPIAKGSIERLGLLIGSNGCSARLNGGIGVAPPEETALRISSAGLVLSCTDSGSILSVVLGWFKGVVEGCAAMGDAG